MKYLEKYNSFSKKNKEYKLLSGHSKLLKRLNLESSLLDVKSLQIVGIYKLFKNLTRNKISDEFIMLIVIYILIDKLNINLDIKLKLQSELTEEIPNFQELVKKFSLALNVVLTISNMVFKKDSIVVGSFNKLLNTKTILRVLSLIGEFSLGHNLVIDEFSYIISDNDQKVLKTIVDFIDKNLAE
jgi:hypothetical protein